MKRESARRASACAEESRLLPVAKPSAYASRTTCLPAAYRSTVVVGASATPIEPMSP